MDEPLESKGIQDYAKVLSHPLFCFQAVRLVVFKISLQREFSYLEIVTHFQWQWKGLQELPRFNF